MCRLHVCCVEESKASLLGPQLVQNTIEWPILLQNMLSWLLIMSLRLGETPCFRWLPSILMQMCFHLNELVLFQNKNKNNNQ